MKNSAPLCCDDYFFFNPVGRLQQHNKDPKVQDILKEMYQIIGSEHAAKQDSFAHGEKSHQRMEAKEQNDQWYHSSIFYSRRRKFQL